MQDNTADFCEDQREQCEGKEFDHRTMRAVCHKYWNDPAFRAIKDGRAEVHEEKPAAPGKAKQALTLALSMQEWIAAGRPTRSDEECARIHAVCEGCPKFDRAADACTVCGCALGKASPAGKWVRFLGIPDAIRMATHHCPVDLW